MTNHLTHRLDSRTHRAMIPGFRPSPSRSADRPAVALPDRSVLAGGIVAGGFGTRRRDAKTRDMSLQRFPEEIAS